MGVGQGRSWQSWELGVSCLGLKRSPRSRGRCSSGSPLPGPDTSARGVRTGQGWSLQPRGAGGPLPRPNTSGLGVQPGQQGPAVAPGWHRNRAGSAPAPAGRLWLRRPAWAAGTRSCSGPVIVGFALGPGKEPLAPGTASFDRAQLPSLAPPLLPAITGQGGKGT
ncbi:hypothetical protein MDA_GLEAN10008699 [Myotis davidii]|uniref:Uncharacterized protein n=1 Tax=Myotis davidii TaxID=225400 RepID=L5LFH2_MYODS|nr:hypothetical protein MDA_GLEAN10008699 [Myotis davidii]